LACHHLDEAAEDIGGEAVLPYRSGLVLERDGGELGDRVPDGLVFGQDLFVEVHLVDQRIAPESIGQTRSVAQQIADGNLPISRHGLQHLLPRLRIEFFHADLDALELRQPSRNRIVEEKVAFFVEDHDRDTGDRFAHRVDAKDRLFRHRRSGLNVLHAIGPELDHLASPRHDGHRTGEVMCFDVPPDEVVDAGEARAGDADVLRCGIGKALAADDRTDRNDNGHQSRGSADHHGASSNRRDGSECRAFRFRMQRVPACSFATECDAVGAMISSRDRDRDPASPSATP
jgi:hypothetical protein